jgi:riboflavin kinase/FMN adenylyltransferase
MHLYEDPSRITPGLFIHPVATVGVFDGLHRGHQALLSALCEWSEEIGGQSVVLTFRAHPRAVISSSGPTHITSLPHRLLLLERQGIEACVVLDFTRRLASTSAENFAREYLCGKLGIAGLLMGFDTRIGHSGEGTPLLMTKIGRKLGFEVRRFDAMKHKGRVISSTGIREHIIAGNLREAEEMLGRPVALLGTVVRGEGRGRKLGFPTANLDLHHEACPPSGVYGAIALFGQTEKPALVSIGNRPTFRSMEMEETIEVHIPGFDGSLYGTDMEVRFISRIRDQHAFDRPEDLIERMQQDALELERLMRKTRAASEGSPGDAAGQEPA